MTRKELLDLIPTGYCANCYPSHSGDVFALSELGQFRLSVILADDDADFSAMYEAVRPRIEELG